MVENAVANSEQSFTWAEIADQLATSATSADRRYTAYTKWRNSQPVEPG